MYPVKQTSTFKTELLKVSLKYQKHVLCMSSIIVPAERVRAGDYETGSVHVIVCLRVRACVCLCVCMYVYVCASVQKVQFATSLSFVNQF